MVELKNRLGDVLNRAEYQGERFIVHRRGKDSVAIISIEDLKLFESLIEHAEGRIDIEAVQLPWRSLTSEFLTSNFAGSKD